MRGAAAGDPGPAGGLVALFRRAFWPLVLLALVPLFYVWSLHSGGTPIFVPHLWPNSYYNTRYGIAALPLLAFAAAALVTIAPRASASSRRRWWLLAAISPWLAYPRLESWICWKESQVNSEARRAWTRRPPISCARTIGAATASSLPSATRPPSIRRPESRCAKRYTSAMAAPGRRHERAASAPCTRNGRWPFRAIRSPAPSRAGKVRAAI